MPIKFAVNIVRLKVNIISPKSDDLALHSRSQLRLKRDKCLTCIIIPAIMISDNIQAMVFKRGMTVDVCMAYIMLMLVSMILVLMHGHSGSAKAFDPHLSAMARGDNISSRARSRRAQSIFRVLARTAKLGVGAVDKRAQPICMGRRL